MMICARVCVRRRGGGVCVFGGGRRFFLRGIQLTTDKKKEYKII